MRLFSQLWMHLFILIQGDPGAVGPEGLPGAPGLPGDPGLFGAKVGFKSWRIMNIPHKEKESNYERELQGIGCF